MYSKVNPKTLFKTPFKYNMKSTRNFGNTSTDLPKQTIILPDSGEICLHFVQHNKLSEPVTVKQRSSYEKAKDRGTISFYILVVALLAYEYYKNLVKEEIIDRSVLRDETYENSEVAVVDALDLKSGNVGHEILPGRSGGHKINFNGGLYYYKEPFKRQDLIKELIVGKLANLLFEGKSPLVYAVETPINDNDDSSKYAFISQDLGTKECGSKTINLEDWARQYTANNPSLFAPAHLGTVMAFNMLMGNIDCKLANLILLKNKEGVCYSIDHEACMVNGPKFLKNEFEALNFIGEFREPTMQELAMRASSDSINSDANGSQPLKSNTAVKNKIEPILLTAIRDDLESGAVIEFYEKFANLSRKELESTINIFGSLISNKEREHYLSELSNRQIQTREFLEEYNNSHDSGMQL